jgi:hypothetical protein
MQSNVLRIYIELYTVWKNDVWKKKSLRINTHRHRDTHSIFRSKIIHYTVYTVYIPVYLWFVITIIVII